MIIETFTRTQRINRLQAKLFLTSTLFAFAIAIQAQSGIFESYAIINTGGSDIFYDLQATTANPDFSGANLGSFVSCTGTLRLDGGQNKTFKCPGDDITNGTIWYRVYPTGSPSGSFTSVNLPFGANLGTGCSGNDQRWEQNAAGINLLAGRTPGSYTLEVYTTANFTFTGGGSGTHFSNNGGANYSATFTVTGGATCPVFVTASGGTAFASYSTLKGAFDAVNAGTHTGTITIDIAASTTETASAVLNSSGAGSASYTSILIRPTADGVAVSGPSETGRGLIEFNGADNVTLDGDNPNSAGINRNLTITNTAANTINYTMAVRVAVATLVITSADNMVIKNCNVNGSGTGRNISSANSSNGAENTTYGIYAGGGASTSSQTIAPGTISAISTVVSAGGTMNGLTISNNAVNACARGIAVQGAATSVINTLTVTNNVVGPAASGSTTSVYSVGITLQGFAAALVSGNTIRNMESYLAQSIWALDFGSVNGIGTNAVVEKNTIQKVNLQNPGTYGVYGINLNAGNGFTIRNNMVSDLQSNMTGGLAFSTGFGIFGIRINAGAGHSVYHNSVHLFGLRPGVTNSSLLSAALGLINTAQTGCDIRNNILSNTISGGTSSVANVSIYLPSGATSSLNLILNNNAYYSGTNAARQGVAQVGFNAGTGFYLASDFNASTTSPATNLRAYTSTLSAGGTNDNASFATTATVPYTSATDLHIPAATSTLLESGGAAVGVTTDIDGDARPNGSAPDMGADEFNGVNPSVCTGTPTAGTISSVPASICASGSAMLTLTGATSGVGISYQWKEATTPGGPYINVGTNSTTYNTGSISATRYYVVDVTCSNGPSTSTTAEFTMTVNSLPTVLVSPPSGLICNPGASPVALTASGASTYSWAPATGLNMTTGAMVTANPTATTTYTVTGTDGNGCQNTAMVTVTVGNKPAISSATATPAAVCTGGNSQLNVVAGESVNTLSGGGITINSSGNATTYPSTIAVSGVPGTITNLKVTVTNLTHSFPVDIDMVLFGPTGAHSIIFTDAIGGSGGITNRTYTFQVGAPVLPTSGFPASGTYGVTGNSYNGSGTPSAVTNTGLGVFNSTNPNGTWSLYVYDDATGDAGSIGSWSLEITTGAPVATYSWSPATFLNNAAIANPLASNVTAQTTYTVTTTAASGCFSTADVTVNINPVPTATVSGGGTVCSTDPLPNVSFALTGTGPWNLTYNNGTNNVPVMGINASPYVITNAPAGTYTVVSVSDGNCAGTGSGSATVAVTTATAWYQDSDGDTYGNPSVSQMACTQPSGYVANNTDCDDNLMAVNPGATEVCNNTDDDCDGMTDEGVQTTFYEDVDGDGYGDANSFTMDCAAPVGYVTDNTDCNDNDPLEKPGQVWYKDQDGDDYSDGTMLTQCLRPVGSYYAATELIATSGDCNDNNAGINPGAAEICDGIDNDCDGNLDNGTFATYYRDMDGDSYGDPLNTMQACSQPGGYVANNTDCDDNDPLEKPGQMWYKDQDGDDYSDGTMLTQCLRPGGYYLASELMATSGDCDDNNAGINPGAAEICDGIDNDCDGNLDNGTLATYYRDMDGDSYGNPLNTMQACSQPSGYVTDNTDCDDTDPLEKPGQMWYKDQDGDDYSDGTMLTQCLRPGGYYLATELIATSGDCDDNNAGINPAAAEICNGIDDDCDSSTDEGVQTTYYLDADGDQYYTGSPTLACTSPGMGYVTVVIGGNDCNDGNAAINPGATEIVNSVDDDCDGMTDENGVTYYADTDNDGFGDPGNSILAGSQPVGYVLDNTDCNDNSAVEKPGQIWYKDTDGDNYAETGASTITACLRPIGYKAAVELSSITGDCNDNAADINPAATEICDGMDNDCNGMTDEGVQLTFYEDVDGDGYGDPNSFTMDCTAPIGYVSNDDDCNDNADDINPGAAETCNGIDDNCSGAIDEGLTFTTYYTDGDGDGYGITGLGQSLCANPGAGYTTQPGDCQDGNPAINPGAAETCNGIDDNCSGAIDEGLTFITYYPDGDGDGYGITNLGISLCANPGAGYTTLPGDCQDGIAAINPGATEICDGIDNNCDGPIDNGVLNTYYRDMDGDGFGNPSVTQQACSPPVGYVANNTDCNDNSALEKPGQTWYADADNDNYSTGIFLVQCLRPVGFKAASELIATIGDCNDSNAAINPAATEVCDGVDNNCNGSTDEGVLTTYYQDSDGDTFGNPSATQQACSQPVGYVANSSDCNDNSALEKPGQVWFKDTDNDGYAQTGAATITQCLRPVGYKAAVELTSTTGDCNDNAAAINPAAAEVCDGIDNDCDGSIDEGVLTTYYQDSDGDTFGNPSATQQACSQPVGYVANSTDCNDNSAIEKPGQVWYKDTDNDGYAQTGAATITQCLRPVGYKAAVELTSTTGDCNDNAAAINPAAAEVCDGIDNNCDGSIDNGVLITYYRDMDGDGFGNLAVTQQACSPPSGFVANSTDCNDNSALEKPGQVWFKDTDNDGYAQTGAATITQCLRPVGYKAAVELTSTTGDCNDNAAAINPAAAEVCDGIDNNCNGSTDEGVQTTFYRDMDSDGFGNPSVTQLACSVPVGYVANNTDCNDNSALEKPGQVWFKDTDGDNYAQTGAATITQCLRPVGYKVASELISTTGDCNDNNAAIRPGATEVCNGVDDNCNGTTDEGLTFVTYYRDMDGDGFGNPAVTQTACTVTPPPGFVANSTDCNDNNAAINPAAAEICDGIDNNCNGTTDEPRPIGGPWSNSNVGSSANGSANNGCGAGNSSVLNVSATGFSTSSSDNLHLVYQTLCGNGEIIARVVNVASGGWAGVTLRESLAPGSKKVALKTQLTSIVRREIRNATNGPASILNFNRPAHVWLRLVRNGGNFTGYTSTDGINWDFAFSTTISMTGCIYAGLFAESINVNVTTDASFDNVSIIGGTPQLGTPTQPASALDGLTVSVYPNPSSGEMTLLVKGAPERNLQLEVTDMMGRIVRNIELPEGAVFTYPLDLSSEPAGVYFLRLRSEAGVESVQRIVLQQ